MWPGLQYPILGFFDSISESASCHRLRVHIRTYFPVALTPSAMFAKKRESLYAVAVLKDLPGLSYSGTPTGHCTVGQV